VNVLAIMRWRSRKAYVTSLSLPLRRFANLIGTHLAAVTEKHGSSRRKFAAILACLCLTAIIWPTARNGHKLLHRQLHTDLMFETALDLAGHPASECEACFRASSAAYASRPLRQRDDSVVPLVWDGSPVVVPELRLVYCSIPKNACTQMKRIVHRVRGSPYWNVTDAALERWHIHKPETNGLIYLRNLTLARANAIMHDPRWTRVVVTRDPIERFASAFLDKCARKYYQVAQVLAVAQGGDVDNRTRVANINCPVTHVQQTDSVEAVLRAVERQAFWHGLASLNSHFRPQSAFCDMHKYSASYLAVDVDSVSKVVPQCVLNNLHVGPSARDSGIAAAHAVLGNASLVTHRTASRELARNWTTETDDCLKNAAAQKRRDPQRACGHLIGVRLMRLYRTDFELPWNRAS